MAVENRMKSYLTNPNLTYISRNGQAPRSLQWLHTIMKQKHNKLNSL